MSNRKLKIVSLVAAGSIVLGVGGLLAVNTLAASPTADSLRQAIANKDLTAFRQALITQATERGNNTTQQELNKMADRQSKMEAVQTAIKNNDYNAFKSAADERMLQRVNSQAEFDKLVAQYKANEERKAKIEEAVKNNDFNAFKAIRTDTGNQPADANRPARPTPTDDQLQTEFNKLVEYYKVHNSLPERGMGMPGMGEFGGKGGHGMGGEKGMMPGI